MEFVDYKCLESLLIEGEENLMIDINDYDIANEKISSATAELIAGIIMAGGAIVYQKYKENKTKSQSIIKNQNAEKQRQSKISEDIRELDNKYHFMASSNDYDKFIKSTLNDIEKDIKKMVNVANRDTKRFNAIKEKLKKNGFDDMEIKALGLGPGYYKCIDSLEDYWIIIEDQDVACVDDLHYAITEALEAKATQDKRYSIFNFTNGDGDEGCVYYSYPSYEQIKKRVSY